MARLYALSSSPSIVDQERLADKPENNNKDSIFSHLFQGEHSMIRQEILDILACPKCKGPVRLNADQDGIICETCKLIYPIRDDIPIMLVDEARPIEPDQTT